MNPHQQEEVTARAEISKTLTCLISGLSWRVGPSYVISEAPKKGLEVPSWSDIAGMGAQMPEAPQVWQLGPMQAVHLQTGPENGHLQPWKCLHPSSLSDDLPGYEPCLWSSHVARAEQGSVKCRARLGAAVDCARAQAWWTRARR